MTKTNVGALILSRIYLLLKVNHTIVSITLGIFSLLLGIGFIFGDLTANNNYNAFNDKYVWSAVFLSYSSVKFIQSLGRMPICIKATASILGLWNWTYILVSFLILDPSPMGPAEPVLLMPLLWELAYMTSLIAIYKRYSKYCRRLDD